MKFRQIVPLIGIAFSLWTPVRIHQELREDEIIKSLLPDPRLGEDLACYNGTLWRTVPLHSGLEMSLGRRSELLVVYDAPEKLVTIKFGEDDEFVRIPKGRDFLEVVGFPIDEGGFEGSPIDDSYERESIVIFSDGNFVYASFPVSGENYNLDAIKGCFKPSEV